MHIVIFMDYGKLKTHRKMGFILLVNKIVNSFLFQKYIVYDNMSIAVSDYTPIKQNL